VPELLARKLKPKVSPIMSAKTEKQPKKEVEDKNRNGEGG